MSAIRGNGYGSDHKWQKFDGPINPITWERYAVYKCVWCDECFKHEYHIVTDIFKTMQRLGVDEFCKKKRR